MSALALPRPPRRETTQRFLVDVGTALVIAVVAGASTWFISEWGTRRGLAMGALVIVLAWLATTRRTLVALAAIMLYIGVIDGFAKLSTGSTAVSLVRDALVFAVAAGVLVRASVSGRSLSLPPLSLWVIGFVALVLVQILNPNAGTLAHSLAGVRQHLEFVPLFFLTYAFVRSKAALRGFVILLLVIGAANGIASFVQFNLSAQQFAAWGPGYAERVLAQGRFTDSGRTFAATQEANRVRPFGLGSDSGAGGAMGAFALGALIALATGSKRVRYLLLAAAMALAVVAAVITSQGRAPIVMAVVVVLTYAVLTLRTAGRGATVAMVGVLAVVGVIVVQAVLSSAGSNATDAFRYEGLASRQIVQTAAEARGGSLAQVPLNFTTYPFGAGLAVAGPASGVAGANHLTPEVDAEIWFSFIVLETGIPGLLLMTGFTISILWLTLTRLRFERDPETAALLAAIVAPVGAIFALFWAGGGLTATTPYGPYLWAVGGIVAYWLVARPHERSTIDA